MKIREAARIILINSENQVLLFKYEDKTVFSNENPNCKPFWVTPGGALKGNESFEEAAKRELFEETSLEKVEIEKWVWNRVHELNWKGELTELRERYYVTYTDQLDIKLDNLTKNEKNVIRSYKWWNLEEICKSDEVFFPENLGNLLKLVIAKEFPDKPIDIK